VTSGASIEQQFSADKHLVKKLRQELRGSLRTMFGEHQAGMNRCKKAALPKIDDKGPPQAREG
jgi:hypothetical protein